MDSIFEDIENVTLHNTIIKELCEVNLPDIQFGDLKLSVFPFENTGKWINLPDGFKTWEESFNKIMKLVPLQEGANTHYVTIDSKFFTRSEFLRREGIHADGNFCVDPDFVDLNNNQKSSWSDTTPQPKPSWGGSEPKPSWGGARMNKKDMVVSEDNSHVKMDWILPYKIAIPIGDYISSQKGGILTVSSEVGCQGWYGTFRGEVLAEGAYNTMADQLTDDKRIVFEKNKLYFMTSNTPHETLLIEKGKRRSFMRITLNHEYLNKEILKDIM